MTDDTSPGPRIGIGSFAFRYAIGTDSFRAPDPMTVSTFLRAAHHLDYDGVQLCENLHFADLDRPALEAIRLEADRLGLFVEVGMRGLTEENLHRHLHIAETLRAKVLRIVVGEKSPHPATDPDQLTRQATDLLRSVMRHCADQGLTIGLENHFDLPADRLLEIVDRVDNRHLGLIFDTTNSLGFIDKPADTLQTMGPRLLSAHLKDFRFEKDDTGFRMRGVRLGEGWLNARDMLTAILAWNPQASFILEMSIQRDAASSVRKTLRQEKSDIGTSTRFLKEALSELTHTMLGENR